MDIQYTKIYKALFSNWFWQFVITGGGILGILKIMLWAQGLRIISFFRVYKDRKKFLNHQIFTKIRHILLGKYIENSIVDIAKKRIAREVLSIEIYVIQQIIKNNLKSIFKNNFIEYLKSFPEFSNDKLVKLFIREYIESREYVETRARNRLTKNNNMSDDDFERLWNVYSEFTTTYEIILHESLNSLYDHKNVYATLWDILRVFEIIVETIYKTIGSKFNLMNGRIDWVRYKNYIIGEDKKRTNFNSP
jgi:hypothetical protein